MIDIVKKVRAGAIEERIVADFLLSRKHAYYKSPTYLLLKGRHDRLVDAIDMKSPITQKNSFNSKLMFPYVRPQYLIKRAVTAKNYRNDPLITLEPSGQTSVDNAKNMQESLSLNFKNTQYRPKCFNQTIDICSKIGVYVTYLQFEQEVKMGWTTQHTPNNLTPFTQVWADISKDKHIRAFAIHPLNYFQFDPDEADSELAMLRGFIDSITTDVLINNFKQNPQNYIKKNIKEVISKAKDFAQMDQDKFRSRQNRNDRGDLSHVKSDLLRFWTRLPIKDNEDDATTYYVEMIGDKIIKIMVNPLNHNIVPLVVGTFRIRTDHWWGNTPAEDVQPHENWINLIMNMNADQALRAMDSMIFTPKSFALDWGDLQNRHKTGGVVRYDDKQNVDIRKMMFPWTPQGNISNNTDWMMREVKESMDRVSPSPDLSRGFNQGGLANNTATAATIVTEMGDTLQSDTLENFGYGQIEIARKIAIMLPQFLREKVRLRSNASEPERIIGKEELMGEFAFKIVSTLHKNRATEFTRLNNLLTAIANFKGTPDQTWQNVQTLPIIKKYLNSADLGDIEEILPEQQQIPGQVPGQPGLPQQQLAQVA